MDSQLQTQKTEDLTYWNPGSASTGSTPGVSRFAKPTADPG